MVFISTQGAAPAIGHYSQALQIDGVIYTSGQIALKSNGNFIGGNISIQAEQVLENLKNILEAGGSSLSHVIKTTVFLVDIGDFDVLNEIYARYFGVHKPARSTVVVRTLPKNALVEIECVAKICKML